MADYFRAQPQQRTRARSIEDVIRRQYDYFKVGATQVVVAQEAVRGFKWQYCEEILRMDPDAVDLFEQADLREKAMAERRLYQAERDMQRADAGPEEQGGQPGQARPGGMFGATPAKGDGSLFGGVGFGATQAGAAWSQVSLFAGTGARYGMGDTPGSNS